MLFVAPSHGTALSTSPPSVQQAYSALAGFLDSINRIPPEDFDRRVAFKPIIRILARQCLCEEKFNRVTAVWWLHQFIKLGGQKLISMYAQLLESVLHCISDPEPELREEAKATNLVRHMQREAAQRCMGVAHEAGVVWQDLLALVKSTDGDFEIGPLLQAITRELPSQHKYTRTAALRWISMLLEKCPEDMLSFIDELLTALLKALSDESDEVVKMNVRSASAPFRSFLVGHGSDTVERVQLEVLGRICLNESHFLRVMNDIVRLFGTLASCWD